MHISCKNIFISDLGVLILFLAWLELLLHIICFEIYFSMLPTQLDDSKEMHTVCGPSALFINAL